MAVDVLLVIPAYREFQRLPAYLRDLLSALSDAKFTSRILIVDDGSPPEEQQKMRNAITPGKFGACEIADPIFVKDNQGKGASILHGWRTGGEANWYGFVDADGAVTTSEVLRLLELAISFAPENSPAIWASRIRMLGKRTDRRLGRFLLGRVFANTVSHFIRIPVYDTQCGFKLVPARDYRRIDPLLGEARFCFDIELLLALHHIAAPVVEIPIDWRDVPGGHVHAIWDGLAMLSRIPALIRRAQAWPKV